MPIKFAISSCWNSHRHDDGYPMLQELAGFGFAYVELSHGIRLSLVPGILKAVEEGLIKVASVHNFCPLPVGVMGAAPNLYEPSAPGHRERVLWRNNTLRTIDFAQRMECDRIVLHSGRVRFLFGDPEGRLEKAMEKAGEEGSAHRRVAKARQKGLKRLHKARGRHMKHLKESFVEVAEQARSRGICFGVENREGFTELPLDEEMGSFLESLEAEKAFGYWHDAGHAQLKEMMGLIDHRNFLNQLRPRLVGWHLHDVSAEGRDHRVPGSGVIDWSIIEQQVREGDVVVMEMSPRLSTEEIAEGRRFLMEQIPILAHS